MKKIRLLAITLMILSFLLAAPAIAQTLPANSTTGQNLSTPTESSATTSSSVPISPLGNLENVPSGPPNFNPKNTTSAEILAKTVIHSTKIIYQNKNDFKISFDIVSEKNVQPGVQLAVQLKKTGPNGGGIVDEKVFRENLVLNPNVDVPQELEYAAPNYLKGVYDLWVVAATEDSLVISETSLGTVTLNGNGQYINIDPDTCYLKVQGESNNTRYTLLQGVDVKPNETLQAICTAKNNFASEETVSPILNTYYRTIFGNEVSSEKSQTLNFAAGETKTINIDIPKPEKPQAYDMRLGLIDSSGKLLSNQLIFHYVLAGNSATIQNLRLDKQYYAKGDIAKVIFDWTGAADSFSGSRLGEQATGKLDLVVSIKNYQGQNCINYFSKEENNSSNISQESFAVPIIQDCVNPHVAVSIKDGQGKTLDSLGFTIKSGKLTPSISSEKPQSKLVDGIVLIILGAMVVAFILIFIFSRKNKRNIRIGRNLILLALLSSGIFWLDGQQARAWDSVTFTVNSINNCQGTKTKEYYSNATYYADLANSPDVLQPGEQLNVYGSLQAAPVCSNQDLSSAYLSATVNGQTKWPVSYNYFDGVITQNTQSSTVSFQAASSDGWHSVNLAGTALDTEPGSGSNGCSVSFVWGGSSLKYCVCQTPSAPTNLNASLDSSGKITISWNGVSGASDYPLGIWDNITNQLFTPVATGTSYVFQGVANHTYEVWALAENNCGCATQRSNKSNIAYVVPPVTDSISASADGQNFASSVAITSGNGGLLKWNATNTNGWCYITSDNDPSFDRWVWIGGSSGQGQAYTDTLNTGNNGWTSYWIGCQNASGTWSGFNSQAASFYVVPAPINGSCGSANNGAFSSQPTSGLCSSGSAGGFNGSGPWYWTCYGANGGSSVGCGANMIVKGSCGSANNQTFPYGTADYSPYTQCTSGTSNNTAFPSPGTSAYWTCLGSNGGGNASCGASQAAALIPGICGSANNGAFNSQPTSGLCSSGSAGGFNGSGPWYWTCYGANGGSSVGCGANMIVNGSCNSNTTSSSYVSDTPPAINLLCSTGNPTTPTISSGQWTWSCNGSSNGGSNQSCTAGCLGNGTYTSETCSRSDSNNCNLACNVTDTITRQCYAQNSCGAVVPANESVCDKAGIPCGNTTYLTCPSCNSPSSNWKEVAP